MGDFTVGTDKDGHHYVEFSTERGTKTRKGGEWEQNRPFKPRMYATGGDHCPVKHFTRYLSLRTSSASTPDSPFYLAVANKIDDEVWYKNQPLGVNTLAKFMKSMASKAGIVGRKTNHSARKTMVTRLIQSNIHPQNTHVHVPSFNLIIIIIIKTNVAITIHYYYCIAC